MANLSDTQIKSDQQEFEAPPETFAYVQSRLPPNGIARENVPILFNHNRSNENNRAGTSSRSESSRRLSTRSSKSGPQAAFSGHSIQVIAEHSNLEMEFSMQASKEVQQEMVARLRELIHRSAQFMHHSSRTKLTTEDVSKALQEIDCDTILGHNNSQKTWASLRYRYVPLARVYVRDDLTVDLRSVASKIIARRSDEPHGQSSTTTSAAGTSTSTFTIRWPQKKKCICDNFVCATLDSSTRHHQRTAKLEKYFSQLCVTIANINCTMFAHLPPSERSLLLDLMFFDLSRSVHLKPVLHRFISFAMTALRTLQKFPFRANIDPLVFSQTKLDSYNVYLRTVRALMSNQSFSHWALHSDSIYRLAEVLLSLSFDLRLCGDLSLLYHQSLHIRSQFAQLYGQILSRFCLPFSDLQNELIALLYNKIAEYHKGRSNLSWTERAAVDYSILQLHRFMGFDVCLRFLMPLLLTRQSVTFEEYFTETVHHRTQSRVQATLQDVAGTAVRGEICLIGELVMKGIALLLVQVADDAVSVDNSNQIYGYFSERFASSLAARLCPLPELATAKGTRRAWDHSWRTRLCHQTVARRSPGEEEGDMQQPTTATTTAAAPAPLAAFTSPSSSRTRTESTSNNKSSDNSHPAHETTSPTNKGLNRKRKGTGLLESMLSTDTTMLAKNESLSMFTESLLEASHRQYEREKPTRIFMFSDEYQRFERAAPNMAAAINSRVVFEGKRLVSRDEFDLEYQTNFKAILKYPERPSRWHALYLRSYNPARRARLPGQPVEVVSMPDWKVNEEIVQMETDLFGCSYETGENPEVVARSEDDSKDHQVTNEEEATPKPEAVLAIKKSIRRQSHIFHYHRRKQHLRSNFSLFTQL